MLEEYRHFEFTKSYQIERSKEGQKKFSNFKSVSYEMENLLPPGSANIYPHIRRWGKLAYLIVSPCMLRIEVDGLNWVTHFIKWINPSDWTDG